MQGVAIATVVFCLPSLIAGLAWLHGFVALPVLYYLVCFGRQQGVRLIATALLIAGVISAIFGAFAAFLFSLAVVPLGYILAKSTYYRESSSLAGIKGVMVLAATWLLLGVIYGVISGTNPYHDALASIDNILALTYLQYREAAELPDATLREVEFAFEQLRLLTARMFPSLLLTSVIFTVWLNMLLGHWLLLKMAPTLAPWHDFKKWRLPDLFVWVAILAGMQLLLPVQVLKTLGLNVVFVMGVLYFFQGLAVLSTFLAKWTVPRIFKVFIYVLVLVQVYGIILLSLTGLADVWVDFRKIKKVEQKRE